MNQTFVNRINLSSRTVGLKTFVKTKQNYYKTNENKTQTITGKKKDSAGGRSRSSPDKSKKILYIIFSPQILNRKKPPHFLCEANHDIQEKFKQRKMLVGPIYRMSDEKWYTFGGGDLIFTERL